MKKRAFFALLATYVVAASLNRIAFVVGLLLGAVGGWLFGAWEFGH